MTIKLRPGTTADASACGRILYEAFKAIGDKHNFPPDFASAEVAAGLMAGLLQHPHFYSVISEIDGRIIGSNFLLGQRSPIWGLGPISVDPSVFSCAMSG